MVEFNAERKRHVLHRWERTRIWEHSWMPIKSIWPRTVFLNGNRVGTPSTAVLVRIGLKSLVVVGKTATRLWGIKDTNICTTPSTSEHL